VTKKRQQLQHAVAILHSQSNNLEQLAKKIEASKPTWLVARLVEPIDRHYQPQPAPKEFTIIATDGSHIDVDRHQPTHCYLINIGGVVLHYGSKPEAMLDNIPTFMLRTKSCSSTRRKCRVAEQPIEGALLGIKRGVEECKRAGGIVHRCPSRRYRRGIDRRLADHVEPGGLPRFSSAISCWKKVS